MMALSGFESNFMLNLSPTTFSVKKAP